MVSWYRWYAFVVAVHVMEVAIVGSAVAIIKLVRPAYDTMGVLFIIAVGMIAGAIYIVSMNRLETHERKKE